MTAPSLTGFAATINFAENTVNATPQLLDSDVTFTDVEGDFNGGSLSLSGLLAEDMASVRNEGAGVGEIGLSGADVTYGGVTIGTLAGGAGSTLTITFNAAATSASIDALIQNLTYANSSETPTTNRDLLLNVVDASGADLGAIPGTPSFAALTGAANPLDGINGGIVSAPTFVDLDGEGDLDLVVGGFFGTLQLFDNNDADDGFTELTGAANPFDSIAVGTNSTPTFVDLDGDGDLDLVLGQYTGTVVSFENTTPRGQVIAVTVTVENDAPTLTGLPTLITVNEALADDVDLSGITLADPEEDQITVTISATSGQLDAVSSGGVLVQSSGSDTLVMSGTALALNGILQDVSAVQFTGPQDVFGPAAATLTISTTDLLSSAIIQGTVQVDITDVVTQPGTSGNDTLNGGSSADILIGDAGNDILNGGADADTLSGGTGIDWLQYAASSAGITVDLNVVAGFQSASGGDATGDVISGFENVSGSIHADTLTGSDEDNVLLGRAGNDVLTGGAGSDILNGGAGNDILRGGTDADTLAGGNGIDWVQYIDSSAGVTVDLNSIAGFQSASGADATGDVISGFERVGGSNHADTLTGNDEDNYLIGRAGSDVLMGGGGNDVLHGGTGADTFIFKSDDGSDQINGGGDSDTVLFTGFDSTDFTIVDLAGSNWTVTEIATGDFDTLTSIEVLAFDDLMLSV